TTQYKYLKPYKLKYEMKYFLIMNPKSQGGKSKKRFHHIWKLLDHGGIKYRYETTQSLDHARQLSQFANKQNYDAIVATHGAGNYFTTNQKLTAAITAIRGTVFLSGVSGIRLFDYLSI
ncbi:unnamed protein product, partial [marine sediment metagenome]